MANVIHSVRVQRLCASALLLAMCVLLPLLTLNNPQLGNALCLMHIPVLLCGFLCGPWYGLCVGLTAPLLRHLLLGAPPIWVAYAMTFELATYGLLAGLFCKIFPKKPVYLYVSLLLAMLGGRIVNGFANLALYAARNAAYTWKIFLTASFVTALPGILLQFVLVPLLLYAVQRAFRLPDAPPQ